jgi:hypothetical protein
VQPIDRDTQISLMKDAEKRMSSFVRDLLKVPAISGAAQRCAFEENGAVYSQKTVKVAKRA